MPERVSTYFYVEDGGQGSARAWQTPLLLCAVLSIPASKDQRQGLLRKGLRHAVSCREQPASGPGGTKLLAFPIAHSSNNSPAPRQYPTSQPYIHWLFQ